MELIVPSELKARPGELIIPCLSRRVALHNIIQLSMDLQTLPTDLEFWRQT